ncbi:MAG TPA: DUF1801 domain-containing protein [Propionicimonas sp.]|jgi:uncharacterized protein YdhG (YjbR/CyaY superfamily)
MGSVDDAIAAMPPHAHEALQHVIDVARRVVPDAEDGVSYGIPALKVRGKALVGVTVTAKHLSVVPFSPAALDTVRDALADFSVSKGTLRFSPDKPVPDEVLERLVRARLAEITG